jgi:hypothetical protein
MSDLLVRSVLFYRHGLGFPAWPKKTVSQRTFNGKNFKISKIRSIILGAKDLQQLPARHQKYLFNVSILVKVFCFFFLKVHFYNFSKKSHKEVTK